MQEDERQEILRRRARAAEMVLRETQLWQARVSSLREAADVS